MAVVRCGNKSCKKYLNKENAIKSGLSHFCDFTCANGQQKKYFMPKGSRTAYRKRVEVGMTAEIRNQVLTRDRGACRLCGGSYGLAVHHINYRSDYRNKPWENELWNLITLCNQTCHLHTVHGNKKYYVPILLGMNWVYYTEGRLLSVPQFEREFCE